MPEKDDVDYNIDRFIIRRINNILLGGVKKFPPDLLVIATILWSSVCEFNFEILNYTPGKVGSDYTHMRHSMRKVNQSSVVGKSYCILTYYSYCGFWELEPDTENHQKLGGNCLISCREGLGASL